VPRDSDGHQCGQDSEVVDKKFLFFFDLAKCADPFVPINGCPTPQICVNKCPQESFLHDMKICKNVEEYKQKLICKPSVNLKHYSTCEQIDQLIIDEKCAKWYLKSQPCEY
jgi:choline transporter-like protein 2/4/5